MRSVKIVFLVSLLCGGAGSLRASSAVLDCIGDTWVDARQPDQRHTRDMELHLLGRQRVALMDFRFAVVRDWKIERATLLLHLDDIQPLKVLGVVPVPVTWNEVEATAAKAAENVPWGARGTLLDVLGRFDKDKGNIRPVREGDLGWVEVDIPPSLIEACAAGRSHGFALFVRLRNGERLVHSRDTVRFAPTLKVEGTIR